MSFNWCDCSDPNCKLNHGRPAQQDERDYCFCGKEIPPGPDFCSKECESKYTGLEKARQYILHNAKFGPLGESDRQFIAQLMVGYSAERERTVQRETAEACCKIAADIVGSEEPGFGTITAHTIIKAIRAKFPKVPKP